MSTVDGGKASSGRIGVLLVDGDGSWCKHFHELLSAAGGCRLVGAVADPGAAGALAFRERPALALVDLGLPEGMEAAVEIMRRSPRTAVIATCAAEECPKLYDTVRQAMRAGLRDLVPKPFTLAEFERVLRRHATPSPVVAVPDAPKAGHLICVFSTKGGVGKTTLAANLAVALARRDRRRVALLDLDLECGNAAALFGRHSPHASIVDLCRRTEGIGAEALSQTVERLDCSVDLLAAPPGPEQAALVVGEARSEPRDYVGEILASARVAYPWVLVDTACTFGAATLAALDAADTVLLLTTPDMLALRNTARGLDVLLRDLEFPEGKVQLVLNRCNSAVGITHANIQRGLNFPVSFSLPSDAVTVISAANTGVPFMLKGLERNLLTQRVTEIAARLDGIQRADTPQAASPLPARRRKAWRAEPFFRR
jgi:pilus assembly protein CpaE